MEYLKLSILKTYATLKGYMQLVKNKKDKFKLNTTNTKKVKIIATVGPATASEDMIRRMFQAGVNGFRLNFSHGTYEWHEEIFKLIKKISEEKNKPVAIIQDLNGPKVQLGELLCPAELELGKTYKLAFQPKQTKTDIIPILHDLSKYMKPGEKLYINDGKIKSIVTAVKRHSGLIFIKITQPGKIISNKGINIPDTNIHSNSITERDIEDVKFGLKLGFDYIALSFIQSEAEVNFFKQMISAAKKHTKIISKIETKSSLQELDKIIEASDAIMVARGDLAPEVGPEKVPIIQREIINKCQNRGKICIVATQMLSSMVNSSVPTRAEVSDIATAVILRTDAVMLSEETAIGEFAIESYLC
jgi:pyruvate kinase